MLEKGVEEVRKKKKWRVKTDIEHMKEKEQGRKEDCEGGWWEAVFVQDGK